MKHLFTLVFTLSIVINLEGRSSISQYFSFSEEFSTQESSPELVMEETISATGSSFDNISFTEGFSNQDSNIGSSEDNKLNSLQLKVYPNPTTDFIRVRCETKLQSELIVEIYDLVGRRIIRKKSDNSENNMQIDMQSFQRSAYLLKAYTSDGKYSRTLRIVKY